ncbi:MULTISPECIES: SMP-30/gluconolactonase/LRE family protein [unclassified Rhodococcus (in: high G+C Gram-positive bacteria)]|uniref:SMP-30/gluconolactonase/LRE family protein n=1 Tax=unclassified Rhodococcus (in: high G+C Gram-positive bacteria) TaxID=192944 RepID=UPI001639F09F|nr:MULTISPECIES: SMP-30/gluconolactonase/LRE family protein [unclassified Rhodococcus (in: high G+C Gram-positive bacteria)]MBC2643188.1 SMP-30/gluconolactonase/LRE family protein [Rhodococcus sp. 3A]MBC2892071.1 SMP-30/gluconolactonase/LRE family protein [Rhodococcus sp. 4CII]
MRVPQFGRSLRSTLRVAAAGALLAGAVSVAAPSIAVAAPTCPGAGQAPVRVGSIPGAALEGATVDGAGRLYTTDLVSGRVFRLDAPGAAAVPVATVPSGGAGALAWATDGSLLVGYGADARVLLGDVLRPGAIAKLNTATNVLTPFASGLSAANGLDVTADGIAYATNDFGTQIGRVFPDGRVEPNWATLPSANGAVLGADDRYLYVSRTFVNPGVSRIPLANPGAPESILDLTGGDVLAAPDGLTLDSKGRPVVPANARGEIWRIDAPGRYCVLGSGLPTSSVVTYGKGATGFAAGRLYRVGFDGAIYEIPGGVDA